MKKVIIIIVLLLVAGSGVLGGMAVMGMGPLASFVQDMPDAPPKVEPPPPPASRMIDVDTLGIPVIDGGIVTRRIFLNVQLEVAPENAERVKSVMPRLQSAFLQEMLVYMPRHLRDRDKIDPVLLQQHLLLIARKITGNRVRSVNLKNFVEQH